MRFLQSTALAIAFFLTPALANADLLFRVTGGELAVLFGLSPFEVSDALQSDEIVLNTGSALLVSGPLLDLDVDVINGLTTYTYGPGTLELTLSVADGIGNAVNGSFSALTDSFSFVVCEGCDTLFGGGTADDFFISLGAGLFDSNLASALHILPGTLGGSIDFGLEDIDGDPSSTLREGFDHRGFANLRIGTTEVPEPSLLLMTPIAVASVLRRRRRKIRSIA